MIVAATVHNVSFRQIGENVLVLWNLGSGQILGTKLPAKIEFVFKCELIFMKQGNKEGFIYTFWSSLLSTSSILEYGF